MTCLLWSVDYRVDRLGKGLPSNYCDRGSVRQRQGVAKSDRCHQLDQVRTIACDLGHYDHGFLPSFDQYRITARGAEASLWLECHTRLALQSTERRLVGLGRKANVQRARKRHEA